MAISKIYISYFYTIRFFTPNMVPFSTAVWDPRWYHDYKSQYHCFYDKRNVINGLRIPPLVPDKDCNGLCKGPENCPDKDVMGQGQCRFLKAYKDQLESINFDQLMCNIETVSRNAIAHISRQNNVDPVPVIIVHESPNTPCSERWPIIKWFNSNGANIQELDYHDLKDRAIKAKRNPTIQPSQFFY